MTKHTTALYKLIILYMLDRVDFPLTKAQISGFILEKEYTTFMTLQESFGELIDDRMVTAKSVRNRTHLSITDEGKSTLHYFEDRITDAIKQEIESYFRANGMELRNEVSVTSDYYRATTGEYEARLTVKEKDVPLVSLTMSVPDRKTAAAICANWEKKNQEVYQMLIRELF